MKEVYEMTNRTSGQKINKKKNGKKMILTYLFL